MLNQVLLCLSVVFGVLFLSQRKPVIESVAIVEDHPGESFAEATQGCHVAKRELIGTCHCTSSNHAAIGRGETAKPNPQVSEVNSVSHEDLAPIVVHFSVESPSSVSSEKQRVRQGFKRGRCLIDGKQVLVILYDANHNGRYEEGDRWSLNAVGAAVTGSTSTEIGERYWFRNVGYRLELERSTGQYATLIKVASRGSGHSSRAKQKVVTNGTPWRASRALPY